ncbi:MAG: class I SAM-dependent methyltransferase, partial [Dehalococcoidia bacterium]|nr:class I SAM-dependent methyltransferase [Dehalococcoidia bacterium]
MTEEAILEVDKDSVRKGLIKYTRKAFHMVPELDRPCILDVGCGSGVPTIELARLSNGQIIGLDIQQNLLDILRRKIEEAGLSDRVKTLNCSMFDMDFPDESFDIIWAEGSISRIGFERGLKEWRRFLKPNGFLVVHDEIGNITEKLEQ